MKVPGGFDAVFRQLTPLVLLGVLVLVAVEPWLPGLDWLRRHLGDTIVLRVCIAALALYVLLLWGESLRLHTMLTGILGAFREFRDQSRDPPGQGAKNPKARLDAARLLIAALGSDDPAIRETSRHNLTRLVGRDLGPDAAAWHRWVEEQDPARGRPG